MDISPPPIHPQAPGFAASTTSWLGVFEPVGWTGKQREGLASGGCAVHDGDRGPVPGLLRSPGMALKKQATPKRWRSKEAKEIVAAVQRAGGQVERTASGHLKVIGPAGSAIVASAPNTGRAGGRAVHNTLATIRSKTGLQV